MSKLSDFLISDRGRRIVNFFYGTGASVVIIGALFKIEHLPGASIMLSIGMGTEAFLFALSGLEPPHKEFDWSLVFPILGYGKHANDENLKVSMPVMAGMGGAPTGGGGFGSSGSFGGGSSSVSSSSASATNIPSVGDAGLASLNTISEDDVRKLSEGIKKLGDTASQLNSIADASIATNTYTKAISGAADAVSSFANSQNSLTLTTEHLINSTKNVTSSMVGINDVSKSYMEKISGITQSLSSINSVYEIQLKSINTQNNTLNSLNAELDKIKISVEGSAREAEMYKEQSTKLTQQIASLNNIYGTMLNAMG